MINLICIGCGTSLIKKNAGFYLCPNCQKKYDLIFDIPYIYKFQKHDLLSLIEIYANKLIHNDVSPFSKITLKKWHKLLKKGLLSSNRNKTLINIPDWASPWYENRFREYAIFKTLTQGINLSNKKILDVGAGLGFDSYNLISEKACITAFEFSPFLAKLGQQTLSSINWIGGSACNLPFKNHSFDYIFCNQTLHHINDLPNALKEMLRVLKIGGSIITIGDSYLSIDKDTNFELDIFNEHKDVLSGINESIISIKTMTDFFNKYEKYLSINAVSHVSNSHLPSESYLNKEINNFNLISLNYPENLKEMQHYFDAFSFKITINKKIHIKQNFVNENSILINPKKFIHQINHNTKIAYKIAQLIPNKFLNYQLLSREHGKFFLLNGLQKPILNYPWRQAYKVLRLFYSHNTKKISFSLSNPQFKTKHIIIKVNGKFTKHISLKYLWKKIKITFPQSKKNNVIEFIVSDKNDQYFLISPLNPVYLNLQIYKKFKKI